MQKKVGNALYVFDTTPFTITEDTDAEVIYVQQEYLKGYLELNTELESKIKTFNQWVLCVNAPWADKVTPGPDPGPGPEPSPDYHLLTLSRTRDIYVYGYNADQLPGDSSEDWFNSINNAQIEAGMIDPDVYYKIYCNAGAEVFLSSDPIEFESMTGLELIQTTEWGEKYGEPVFIYNHYNADSFIVLMEKLRDSLQTELLKADFDYLISCMQLAKDTHDVEYMIEIYRILHDMDYFLFRYGIEDMGNYVDDISTISKYYGVLSVYAEAVKE